MPEIIDFGGGTSPLAGGLNTLSSFLGGYTEGTQQRKKEDAAAAEQQRLNKLRDLKISQLEEMALEDEAADRLQSAMTGPMFQEEYLNMLGDFDRALFGGITNELELIPGQDFEGALTPEALRIFRDPNLSREDRRRFMDILKGRQENALRTAEMGRVESFYGSMMSNKDLVESDEEYAAAMEAIRADSTLTPSQKHAAMRAATVQATKNFQDGIQRTGVHDALNQLFKSDVWTSAFSSPVYDDIDGSTVVGSELNADYRDQWLGRVYDLLEKGKFAAANGMIRALQDSSTREFFHELEAELKTAKEAREEAENALGPAFVGAMGAAGVEIEPGPKGPEPLKTTHAGDPDHEEIDTSQFKTTDDGGFTGEPHEGAPLYTEDEAEFLTDMALVAEQHPEDLINPFEDFQGTGLIRSVIGDGYRKPEDRLSSPPGGVPPVGGPIERTSAWLGEMAKLIKGGNLNPIYEAVDEYWKAGGGATGDARARITLFRYGMSADEMMQADEWKTIRDSHPDNFREIFWEAPEGMEKGALTEAVEDRPVNAKQELSDRMVPTNAPQAWTASTKRGDQSRDKAKILEDIESTPGARGKDGFYDSFVEYGAYNIGGFDGVGSAEMLDLWLYARRENLPMPVFATNETMAEAQANVGPDQMAYNAEANIRFDQEEYKASVEEARARQEELQAQRDKMDADSAAHEARKVAQREEFEAGEYERMVEHEGERLRDEEDAKQRGRDLLDLEYFFMSAGRTRHDAYKLAREQNLDAEIMAVNEAGELMKWRRGGESGKKGYDAYRANMTPEERRADVTRRAEAAEKEIEKAKESHRLLEEKRREREAVAPGGGSPSEYKETYDAIDPTAYTEEEAKAEIIRLEREWYALVERGEIRRPAKNQAVVDALISHFGWWPADLVAEAEEKGE